VQGNVIDVLFIGDIVGKPGRQAIEDFLPELKKEYNIDLVIANIENAAGGFGCTRSVYHELLSLGIDFFTSGNHIYDQKEFVEIMDDFDRLIRPLNYPPGNPGKGYSVIKKNSCSLAVVNLLGRVFTSTVDCPFRAGRSIIDTLQKEGYKNILIDIHAEATSEKKAIGYYFEGMVSAVVGTHTHVVTADESILKGGTAYITDVGMTGCIEGILGFSTEPIIERFLTQRSVRFSPPKKSRNMLQAVLISIDNSTGKAIKITRIDKRD